MHGGGWSRVSPDAHSIMTHAGVSVAAHAGLNNTKIKRSVPLIKGDGVLNCTAHNRWVYEMNTGGKNKIDTELPQAASDPSESLSTPASP